MAEVIGLAASISTISGLALASARAAKHLLEVAQNAGGISDEIKSVALGLRLSGFSLNEAYRSLKSRDIIDPLSPVYERLRKSGFLADLKQSTKLIKARIKRFPVLVKGLESRIKFVPAFKWLHTHRQEIMSLRQDMESIKTSVSVLVSAAQLELNLIDAKTADPIYLKRLEQDNENLSASLKAHKEMLREQRHEYSIGTSRTSAQHGLESSAVSFLNSMESLLDLSHSMGRYGTVKGHGSPSTTNTAPSPASVISSISEAELALGSAHRGSRQPRPLSVSAESPRHRTRTRPPTAPVDNGQQAKAGPAVVHPQPSSDIASKQHSVQIHTINPANFQATSISYTRNTEPQFKRQLTGLLDSALKINLMSIKKALESRIERSELGPGDPRTVRYASGVEERVVCKSEALSLNKGAGQAELRKITFFITEHLEPEIIFGESFC